MLKILFFLLLILFVVAIFIGLFSLSKFRIKNITVSGVSDSNKTDFLVFTDKFLEKKYFGLLPYDNIFIFPKKSLRAEIVGNLLYIKEIKFDRQFPNEVAIEVNTRRPFAIWCEKYLNEVAKASCVFVDEKGFAFKKSPIFSGNIFRQFFDMREEGEKRGGNLGQVVSETLFIELNNFIKQISSDNIEVARVDVKDGNIYELETSAGWRILLNGAKSFSITLDNLKTLLDTELAPGKAGKLLPGLEYIDLRFGDKVFYKFKND